MASAVTRRLTFLVTSGLLALGLWLRLDGFTSSLWLDEFGTFWAVEPGFGEMLRRIWQSHSQSPFYYALTWLPLRMAGESEAALRLPSMLFGSLAIVVLWLAARTLGGARASAFALLFGSFSVPLVRASVEARPYGLVLLAMAVALTGFERAVLTATWPGRLAWVVGGAAVAWTHYPQYLSVAGLILAYALLPGLRVRYRWRAFAIDTCLQVALVALCLPQVVTIFADRGSLTWLDERDYLAYLALLVPLLPAMIGGEIRWSQGGRPAPDGLRRALWIAILVHVGVLELTWLVGVNLRVDRYLLAILAPAIVLSAVAAARLPRLGLTAVVLWFAVLSGRGFIENRVTQGNCAGRPDEDWPGAVAELASRLDRTPGALVLYRSGFVEEDRLPPGAPPPATLAPLAGLGHAPPPWNVKSLTFRWNRGSRADYFAQDLAPLLARSQVCYLIGRVWGPEPEPYLDNVASWVQGQWRDARVERHGFGGVQMMVFERR